MVFGECINCVMRLSRHSQLDILMVSGWCLDLYGWCPNCVRKSVEIVSERCLDGVEERVSGWLNDDVKMVLGTCLWDAFKIKKRHIE